MEMLSSLLTIKQANNKGYTLLEMMIVISMLSVFSLLSLTLSISHSSIHMFHHDKFVLEVEHAQLKAIANQTTIALPFKVDQVQLTYNAFGNINQAKSGQVSYPYHFNVVFFLGFGRYEIK